MATAVKAAIVIRDRSDVDPGLLTAPTRAIEFVGADVNERGSVAMVSVLEYEDVFTAGVRAGEAEG
jgi:hypothetical protein